MNRSSLLVFVPLCLVSLASALAQTPAPAKAANDPAFEPLAADYAKSIQPLVKQFCLECHSTAAQEGELDLERFASFADVRRETKAWLKVLEMLDNGEMPPKDAVQPSADQRKVLRQWVDRYLNAEALALAGDPGPVVLRRLSNAEYTYTVRDLTGAARPGQGVSRRQRLGRGLCQHGQLAGHVPRAAW